MSYAQLVKLEDQIQTYFQEKYEKNQTAEYLGLPEIIRLDQAPTAAGQILTCAFADQKTYRQPALISWSPILATRVGILESFATDYNFSPVPQNIQPLPIVNQQRISVDAPTGRIFQPIDSAGSTFYITFNLGIVNNPLVMSITEVAITLVYFNGTQNIIIATENLQTTVATSGTAFLRYVSLSAKVVGANTSAGSFFAQIQTVDGSTPSSIQVGYARLTVSG
jgi:hypothetical protein